jgi:riboflavin synthase alpha subunit
MFTGLIREVGRLRAVAEREGVTRLDIAAPRIASRFAAGDSVAVNGICLTVTTARRDGFWVDAAAETRRVTTLASWRPGDPLHLEPSLRVGDPLDGHLVLGHVDGVGRIAALRRAGGSLFMTVTLDPDLARYLMPKGSVAVDGVSLTVDAGPFRDRFAVNLIPFTLQWTFFDRARVGQAVNLEMDVLVKAARTTVAGGPAIGDIDAGQGDRHATAERPGPLTLADIFARGWDRGEKRRSS